MATVFAFPKAELSTDQRDDMKLRDEDKKWLSEEIMRQVTAGISSAVDSFKPHGWRRATSWVREWGPSAIIIATPLTLLGLLITVGIFAANGIKENAQFQGSTVERLNAIDGKLRELQAAQSPSKVLKELTTLDKPQLVLSLPALQKISEQPIDKVNPSPATLKDVAYKLRDVDQSAEDYWPAVLKFLQFASAGLASNVPAPGSRPIWSLTNVGLNGINLIPPKSIVKFDGGLLQDVTITDSRVIFTNNPVTMKNVRFVNCAFEFPDTNDPSPAIKKTGEILLASGITSGYVPNT